MTGHAKRDVDVESLLHRRRGGCLDAFLVGSIVFLFVALAAVAAGGAVIERELRAQLKSQRPTAEFERLTGDDPNPTHKMKNSIYLEPKSRDLKSSTMLWAPVTHESGSSPASNFKFNEHQGSLMPNQEGTYFIYVEFNFTCTHICNASLLIVQVGDVLTCEMELPYVSNETHVIKRCWKVSHVSKQKFVTKMTVPKEEPQTWGLAANGSRLGLFLVD